MRVFIGVMHGSVVIYVEYAWIELLMRVCLCVYAWIVYMLCGVYSVLQGSSYVYAASVYMCMHG